MLLAPYDAIFFKEPFLTDHLRAMLDLPVYYLPQACILAGIGRLPRQAPSPAW